MSEDFEKMAKEREIEAEEITDLDVWKSVVKKAIGLDMVPEAKADILLQSIPDLGVIFSQLKMHNNQGNISDEEYHDILEICIDKLEKELGRVDFDPLKYKED